METLFYNIKQQYDPSVINFTNYAPLIKIILHKYFYSNNNYLLNIISFIRSESDVTDVIYNHNNRTYVIKIPKGKMTKVQKEILKANNNKKENEPIVTMNDYFYNIFSMAFHRFFLLIKNDFEKTIYNIPDVESEDIIPLKEAFHTLIQYPILLTNIVQIILIAESDNCIVLDV